MCRENAADAGLAAVQEICCILRNIIDRLITEITGTFSCLRDFDMWFGFLLVV